MRGSLTGHRLLCFVAQRMHVQPMPQVLARAQQHGPHGQVQMECLSDYKEVRYDKDVRKAYLEGRFSGVPHLKTFGQRTVKSTEPSLAH